MTNRQIKQRDFLVECRREMARAVEKGEPTTVEEIAWRASQRPAPGYYLEYGYARRQLGRLMAGDQSGVVNRGEMWRELLGRIREVMDRTPDLKFGQALSRVLAVGGASSYFYSASYAGRLYKRLRAHHRRHPNRLRRRHLF